MPYIKQVERDVLDEGRSPCTPGQLNYVITGLINEYLSYGLSYEEINAVIGVLECAKLELYRRVAAPYEEQKRYDNGDVYDITG